MQFHTENPTTTTGRKFTLLQSGLALSLALVITLFAGLMQPAAAQTVIGGEIPDSSAMLELRTTNRGLLLPRLSSEQRSAIVKPQPGLIVFNTTLNCLEINMGTATYPFWTCLMGGFIASLDCGGAVVTGSLTTGTPASGVSVKVPYAGGNGGTYSSQAVASTGVTGLTATLAAGSFANGADSLNYVISGTPADPGTASFPLSIGGKSCTLSLTVSAICRAKVTPTQYKKFMCHNLGAYDTSLSPTTPTWQIYGCYWQWGRKGPDPAQWLNTNTPNFAFGATGPDVSQANSASIPNWQTSTSLPADTAWVNSQGQKTSNDPCPQGYRLPTKDEWAGVKDNNTITMVGTWSSSTQNNYTSARFFGPDLMLVTAGNRGQWDGARYGVGSSGNYWSSTPDPASTIRSWGLGFNNTNVIIQSSDKRNGGSIRCIEQ